MFAFSSYFQSLFLFPVCLRLLFFFLLKYNLKNGSLAKWHKNPRINKTVASFFFFFSDSACSLTDTKLLWPLWLCLLWLCVCTFWARLGAGTNAFRQYYSEVLLAPHRPSPSSALFGMRGDKAEFIFLLSRSVHCQWFHYIKAVPRWSGRTWLSNAAWLLILRHCDSLLPVLGGGCSSMRGDLGASDWERSSCF